MALLPGSPAIGKGNPSRSALPHKPKETARPISAASRTPRTAARAHWRFPVARLLNQPARDWEWRRPGTPPPGSPSSNPLIATVTSAAGDPVAGGARKNSPQYRPNTASATLSGNPAGQATIGTAGSGAASTNVSGHRDREWRAWRLHHHRERRRCDEWRGELYADQCRPRARRIHRR